MITDKKINIIFKNEQNNFFNLYYRLNNTYASEIWYNCVKKAKGESHLSEIRHYNFDNITDCDINLLCLRLNNVIDELKKYFPEMQNEFLDTSSTEKIQRSLNFLHRNFAHNHLIEKRITTFNLKIWDQFNALIHKIESQVLKLKNPAKIGELSRCRIEYNWHNPFPVDIPDNCYHEFRFQKEFGDLQPTYYQVGRHFVEIFFANDTEVPPEHIQPVRFFSANARLYLGPDIGSQEEKMILKKIEDWFALNHKKFNQLGYFWGDPKLAIGNICVAKLENPPKDKNEKLLLQKKLSEYRQLVSIEID